MKTFLINGTKIQAKDKIEAIKKYKDSKVSDKSYVDEVLRLAKAADKYARLSRVKENIPEVKQFLADCLSSYNYIKSAMDGFVREVKKNTEGEKNLWKEGSEKFQGVWYGENALGTNMQNGLSTICDGLDNIVIALREIDKASADKAKILYDRYDTLSRNFWKAIKNKDSIIEDSIQDGPNDNTLRMLQQLSRTLLNVENDIDDLPIYMSETNSLLQKAKDDVRDASLKLNEVYKIVKSL